MGVRSLSGHAFAVLRNERAVAASPAEWLPWTYRTTLARLGGQRAGAQAPTVHFVQPVGNA